MGPISPQASVPLSLFLSRRSFPPARREVLTPRPPAPRRSRSGGRPPGGLGPAAASPPRSRVRSALWRDSPLPPPSLPAARVGTAGRAERQFILICLIVRSSRAIIPYNFRNKQV